MSGKKIFRIFPRLTMGRKRGIIYVWRIKAHSRNGRELTIMSEKRREIRIRFLLMILLEHLRLKYLWQLF